jgi:hypothetical protein
MTIRLFVVHFVNKAGDQSRTSTLAVRDARSSAPALCRRAETQLNVTQEGGPWKVSGYRWQKPASMPLWRGAA